MSTRTLRIHADPRYLEAGKRHVPMLWPFFGAEPAQTLAWPQIAKGFVARAREWFELVDLEAAEIAVFPHDWKQVRDSPDSIEHARRFVEEARSAGATPVFFYASDFSDPLPFADVVVIRTSMLRSRRQPGEYAQPGFHEDLLEHCHGALPVRPRQERAIVGFCGMALEQSAPIGAAARLRRLAGNTRRAVETRRGRPVAEDVFVRAEALRALRGQSEVRTNIVVRTESGGGAFYPELDRSLWPKVRREYVDNMLASDYVLCVRGVGNWSIRLTETLSMGRIPVFVDTDCVLPYDFRIPWRDYVVWVERRDVSTIGERVAAFHAGLSDADFVELQHRCRRVWEEFLSIEGFFEHFHLHFGSP